jgi:dienelactone hydrolase
MTFVTARRGGTPVGRGVAFVVAALVCLNTAGCSGSRASALSIRVSPGPVSFEDASPITISGADPAQPVTVQASARDAEGTTWTSRAAFSPGSDGTIDLATAGPRNGSYTGAHATGLIWSMTADSRHPTFLIGTDGAMTVTFTAAQTGRTTGRATQQRWFRAPGVTVTQINASAGFVARMYTPSHPAARAGAVMVVGGSEGGLLASAVLAEALASRGHPALALAYFGTPGLPKTLANIPLEYFARALAWLNKQPGVDAKRTAMVGASRGSEAALLVGAFYPDLVHAVIATSPTSFVHGGWPDITKPAWTWRGKALVHGSGSGSSQTPPVDTSATIPVTRIRGPVLLLCGTDDALWPSCTASDTVRRELAGRSVTVLREAGAGHLVDFFVPNLPLASTTEQEAGSDQLLGIGGTVQADALGRLDAWPAVLKFLDDLPG